MNISSLVIRIAPENMDEALASLSGSGLCDIFFHERDKGMIVVTIEGRDVGEEMDKMKAIEKMPHVLSAALVYAYGETELSKAIQKLEASRTTVPDALREQ